MVHAKLPDLSAYFESLFKTCKLKSKLKDNLWEALEAAYGKPPRTYHTIKHAVECALMA